MSETTTPGTPGTSAITVRDVPERSRFEIYVDGEFAGFTEYHDRGKLRVFPHTVIEEAFGGRGLSGTLVRQALDTMRAEGRSILPLCPVVRGFIVKHPEYADLVPAERHAEFGLA